MTGRESMTVAEQVRTAQERNYQQGLERNARVRVESQPPVVYKADHPEYCFWCHDQIAEEDLVFLHISGRAGVSPVHRDCPRPTRTR